MLCYVTLKLKIMLHKHIVFNYARMYSQRPTERMRKETTAS